MSAGAPAPAPATGRRVFVSWYDGDREPEGARLLDALRACGLACDHSPRSGGGAEDDPRWPRWYGEPEARPEA